MIIIIKPLRETRQTFKARTHEVIVADAAVQRVDIVLLGACNEVECALVGIGH